MILVKKFNVFGKRLRRPFFFASLGMVTILCSACSRCGLVHRQKVSLNNQPPVQYLIRSQDIAADGRFYVQYVQDVVLAMEAGDPNPQSKKTAFNQRMLSTYEPVAFVNGDDFITNKDILMAVFMKHKSEPGRYLLAIRGTMSPDEARFDLEIDRTDFIDVSGRREEANKVHDGFFTLYTSLRGLVFTFLRENNVRELDVACHSLGCGVGFLFLYDALQYPDVVPSLQMLNFYGYGAPRVGGKVFLNNLTEVLKTTKINVAYVNFINSQDVVPKVPPAAFGYCPYPAGYGLCFKKSPTSKDSRGSIGFAHSYYSHALNKILLGDPSYASKVGMEFC
jgi:hypothetical protein